jgi:hypothetical protein
MKFNNNYIYIGVIVLILAIGGYFCWKFFKGSNSNQNSQANSNAQQSPGGQSGFGGRQGSGGRTRGNFKPLHGTISSVSAAAIVMKADDGSSKTINVSDSTRISSQVNGQRTTLAITDLKQNDEINVIATDTTTATIDARMIFIGAMPTMGQRPSGQQDGSTNQNNWSGPSGQTLN